jgi:small GTP-binding protein
MKRYNIAIVGDAGVGKTALVKSLRGCDFQRRYVSTVGCEVHPHFTNTNTGDILLNIYDFGGKDKYFNNPNVDYPSLLKTMDLVVIVHSPDIPRSYRNANTYWRNIVEKPVLIVANKKDVGISTETTSDLYLSSKNDAESVGTFEQTLASILTGDKSIQVIGW